MTDTAIRFVKRETVPKFIDVLRRQYPRLSLKYYTCKIPFAPALQSPTIISPASPESANLIVVYFSGNKAMDIMMAGGMKGVFVQFSPDLSKEDASTIQSLGEGIVESYTKSATLNKAVHTSTYLSMKIAPTLIFLSLGAFILFTNPLIGALIVIMSIISLIVVLLTRKR